MGFVYFSLCYRDQNDKDAQVKFLVGCKVESFKDSKRNFAMRIAQPKEPDMYLSAEDEIQFIEWLTRLQMATKVQSSFESLDNIDGSTWNIAEDSSRDSMAIDSSYASSAGSCRTSIVSLLLVHMYACTRAHTHAHARTHT